MTIHSKKSIVEYDPKSNISETIREIWQNVTEPVIEEKK